MKSQGFCIALFAALALASNAVPDCKDGSGTCDDTTMLQSRLSTESDAADFEEDYVEESEEDIEALSAWSLEGYSEEEREILSAFKYKPEKASDAHTSAKGYEVITGVKETCKKCDSDCQKKQMKASFLVCDDDKNGLLELQEVVDCMFDGDMIDKAKYSSNGKNHEANTNVNATAACIPTGKAQTFVNNLDEDEDGYLNWAEFWDARASRDKSCDSSRSLVELNERELLSQRTVTTDRGNCISDIAKNVWTTVTSTCERSVNVKDCWKSWKFWTGAFWSCRWKTVTETFTCLVDKLVKVVTQIAQGFADCWKSVYNWLKDKVGGAFMDLINNCNTVDNCLKELLKGPKALWDKIVDLAKKGVNALLNNGPLGTGIKYVSNVVKKIPPMAKEVGAIAVDIGVAVGKFIKGAISAIRDLGNINMCATSGYGFWYFQPTDCGAFGRMKDIFKLSNLPKIPSIFLDVCKKFGTCLIKLGMLSLPSPFLDVKVKTWCVPTFLQPVVKGIVGTFRFIMAQIAAGIAGCSGHHGKQPVCILVTDIRKIGDRIKTAFSGALLLEAAERVGDKLHGDKSRYLQGNTDKVECATGDFSFFIAVAGGIGAPPGWRFTHFADSLGIKLQASIGCRNGILFADLALGVSASLFIAGINIEIPDPADYAASFKPLGITLGFSIGTPGTDIVSWSGSFDLAAAVLIGNLVLKIGLGFAVLPEPKWPSGFSVSPKIDKEAFIEEEVARQQQLQEAQEAAETTQDKVYATVGVLLQQFRDLDHEEILKSGFAMSAFEEGAARMAGEGGDEGAAPPIAPKEAALNAGLGVTFCFTCKVSGGQPTEAPPANPNVPAPGNGAGPGYLEASNNGNTIHSSGGTQSGHSLTMHACTRANNYPNCQFALEPSQTRAGMYYIKAKDRATYIHSSGGTQAGHGLTMHACTKANDYPNCQWALEPSATRAGMYYIKGSDRATYAHASGGTHGGARLTMHACHKANNYYNCQWRMYVPPNLLQGPQYIEGSDRSTVMHASGGSQPGSTLTMHACTRANNYPNCQFILEESTTRTGMYYIKAKDRSSYVHASGGTQPGHTLTMHACTKANNYPNCQWAIEASTTRSGMYYIRGSDRSSFAHAHGGTQAGHKLTMHQCHKGNNYANCQWKLSL
jgi:hypothetical protein